MYSFSKPLCELDCNVRMFVASLCLTDPDLQQLGLLPDKPRWTVSDRTAARGSAHCLCKTDPSVARAITDLLDLRHSDVLMHVRAHTSGELLREAGLHATRSTGEELAAWAWALLTDPREDVASYGQRLMVACYVRGMQQLSTVGSE